MKLSFTWFHNMSNRNWCNLGVVAAVVFTAALPGELITISAFCNYDAPNGAPAPQVSAECSMVVLSPAITDTPVYLTTGWERTTIRKDGTKYTYHDNVAAGRLVRGFVWMDEQVELADGILARDGRVLVDGKWLDRAEYPAYAGLYAQGPGE